MIIRPETSNDLKAIRHVNEQAFGRPLEADIIDALRGNDRVILSLVAFHEEQIAGHILFFPVTIQGEQKSHAAIGLGPMAVLPQFQKQGIGSALIRKGLEELQKQHHFGVIVLGHAEFYPRFGFVPASQYGIKTQYEVPDNVFMATELQPGGLADKNGTVIYSEEFDEA